MAVSVALVARAVTNCELAFTSCLVRRLMVTERVVNALLSAAVAVARLAIASVISAPLLAFFSWPNAQCPTVVFSQSS